MTPVGAACRRPIGIPAGSSPDLSVTKAQLLSRSQCTSCRCEAALPVMVVLSASDFCFKNCNLHKASRVLMIPVLYQLLQGIFANRAKYFRIQIWFSSSSSQDGWTPLHLAIQSRNRDITMILLVNGADETRRNKMPAFSNYAIIVAI
uniref:Uncharacterized protein n=1 Tax=Oryza rufipogon TaxID=4529 RepID=A0A0E0QXC1_ORYRU